MFECSAISEKGPGRLANEDYAAADVEAGVFAVADGMGGRPGGAQASRTAVTSFVEAVRNLGGQRDELSLKNAFWAANSEVRALGQQNPELEGLGTTLSAAVMNSNRGKIVHVGDSRIYLLHKQTVRQLTVDHTVTAALLARNYISQQGALRHPLRNMLARSLGTDNVEPDISDVELLPGDRLFFATDGLANSLGPEPLARLLEVSTAGTAEELCRMVMQAAMAQSLTDDATALVVRFVEGANGTR